MSSDQRNQAIPFNVLHILCPTKNWTGWRSYMFTSASCSERYHSSFQSPYLGVSSRLIFLTIQYSRHLSCLYVMTTLPVRGFLGQIAQWRHLRTCIKSTPIRHRTRSHHTSFPSTRRCVII